MQLPPFLLRRLYVKGSLKDTKEGFRVPLRDHDVTMGVVGRGEMAVELVDQVAGG